MEIEATAIPEVKLLRPKLFADARGVFAEVYKQSTLEAAGLPGQWVQDNQSRSLAQGTVRGLHFQSHPFAQAKLVRVLRGRILDVVVDLRRSSATFGQHVSVELSADNWLQLYVPVGFAHGFCTLTPEAEVHYKVTAPYAAANDHGVAWDDPDLAIAWPVAPGSAVLSDKDARQPRLRDLDHLFD